MSAAFLGVLGTIAVLQGFTLDASGSRSVILPAPVDSVRAMLQRTTTLERHMPGVVGIDPCGQPEAFTYRTVREIPFSGEMHTDFHIRRAVSEDGNVAYRTPDNAATNWMSFRFNATPAGDQTTELAMTLRVRLVRENGTAIHILAPLLGEEFLSEQMERDITAMLDTFAERFSAALGCPMTGGGTDAR
jgi:hypothetical protein